MPIPGHYDELVGADGRIRPMWSELSADFVHLGTAGLGRLDTRLRRLIEDDGITYTEVNGSGEKVIPVPWRLDPIPLLVSADDWSRLEAGLLQRSRVLDEVLTDVYGSRRTLTSGLLPPEIVFGNTGYVRAAHGITIPGRHQLFLHACDISRWGDGQFRVIADWAQAPSGAGYALADRRVVSTAIPESFEHSGPRPLTPFARAMRMMLIEAAPVADVDDPMVVVLSPGVHSETAFDQAYLAATLGFPLVESADLVVRDGALWMRSLGTLKRVDVVLRRVDSEFSDPLDLRPDSQLGVVGLVEVLRRGAVTVVNTLGSGLLESPALTGFLPRISRALLGEELLLESAPSYWGGDETELSHLLANLSRLVIRSAVDGSTIFGPGLAAAERAELKARVEAAPWQWVGQEPAQFSVAPAVQGYGGLAAAPVGMRLFALARRGGYTAMTGGLGQLRHRLAPDRSVIKVAAKDVWVRTAPSAVTAVSAEPHTEERLFRPEPVVEAISSPRVLNDLFWMGRYSERAESVARLLIATHDRYQDYRYRPWLEGAEAVPVLMAALARSTGTIAPPAVVSVIPRPTPPVPQQPNPLHAKDSGPNGAPTPAGGSGAEQSQSGAGQSQSVGGQAHSTSGPSHPNGGQTQSTEGQPRSNETRTPSSGGPGAGSEEPSQSDAAREAGRPTSGMSQSMPGMSQSSSGQSMPGMSQSGAGQSMSEASQSIAGQSDSYPEPEKSSASDAEGRESGAARADHSRVAESRKSTGMPDSEDLAARSGRTGSGATADSELAAETESAIGSEGTAGPGESVRPEAGSSTDRPTNTVATPEDPLASVTGQVRNRASVAGASREGYEYLVSLTIDRELPGSLAFAIDRYGSAARAVRDQLSQDTWMILSAVDRALAEYRDADTNEEAALSAVHSLTLAALLSLSGIGSESLVRDAGWYVMDIGKRIERGLALTALMSGALTENYGGEAEQVVTESVLRAAESSVSYRRRHRDSVRISSVASLLLFDASNPRSLAYQLDRLDAAFQQLPGASGSSRPQRLLADAQRMLRRVDPADLEATDADGKRAELAELLEGVHLRLRKVSESFETTKLALPAGIQPLWGSTRIVG
ncbi:circularly permuted type 2 ATP-grasp protein [Nocardia sp. NEAU-351]|uniref:Circularly permuted type 2 ATP-grasp protein n=2 Tax=Nocardia bovistercoris TaxID=2785916 RepID=A0A931IEK7_9NOCA|nr:circularly permuted type 2 ATP-grasp protein [Nocardia bovistercoris]